MLQLFQKVKNQGFCRVIFITVVLGSLQPAMGQQFQATGNTDTSSTEGVVVTFENTPVTFSFNDKFPFLDLEKDVTSFGPGFAETYDADVGGGSFETAMDGGRKYVRTWIESQNDARVTVWLRGALCNNKLIIAHTDGPVVAPHGAEGDWVFERYLVYPDGIHVRLATIYTQFAQVSKPFGWRRRPPNYVHEFMEALLRMHDGKEPEDHLEIEALTLMKLDGTHGNISYDPYPIHIHPSIEQLINAFGEFSTSNMMVVNAKTEHRAFVIGMPDSCTISPYSPEVWPMSNTFIRWGHWVALGHMINWKHFRKTETSIAQVYLEGTTTSRTPWDEVVPLGRSWVQAPELTLKNEVAAVNLGYEVSQRAYLIDMSPVTMPEMLDLEIAATADSPLYNPAFLLNEWGSAHPVVEVNGTLLDSGSDYRSGMYDSLQMDTGSAWHNAQIIWIPFRDSATTKVRIWPKGYDASIRPGSGRSINASGSYSNVFKVFDIHGKHIRNLPSESFESWDGKDGQGRTVPKGVYFLTGGTGKKVKKIMYMDRY